MVTLNPISRALVPNHSGAAQRLSSPNYDEFQGDQEIYALIQQQPESVLRVTMPHCNAPSPDALLEEGSPEALEQATAKMSELVNSASTQILENMVWVYEIEDPLRPGIRQIGLGGMARIDEIRTEANPNGSIIRNEGVREKKARGRADLIEATQAIIGTVNNAVDDTTRALTQALESYADSRACAFSAVDEQGNRHSIWVVSDPAQVSRLTHLLAAEPCAYVADGNHRSAAAAMLGGGEFLAVFFPAHTLGLAPYNRLVRAPDMPLPELEVALSRNFTCVNLGALPAYQPEQTHQIGLYTQGTWYSLTPHASAYDASNAVESIDASIVQRKVFDELFGIDDPRDNRLTFVGGNRDAAYLKEQVDTGNYTLAITLPPVTMEEFIEVCRQNRIMPPKSTWFQPKIRSGLVIALLD